MKWTSEAEEAVKNVPFFVRKKVRSRVEQEASAEGKTLISMAEVNATRTRFISGMDSEIKGYQIEACFGQAGCPNRAVSGETLLEKIEELFKAEKLLDFLRRNVNGKLKYHHEFRVSISDCPNACSQPQIKDIGILGGVLPQVTDVPCSLCGACEESCRENAVAVNAETRTPVIDLSRCLRCGKCVEGCPTGTILEKEKGFRIQLGGKLGRHPRLASEIPGLFSEDEVVEVVKKCIAFYKSRSKNGRRFSEIYEGPEFLDHQ